MKWILLSVVIAIVCAVAAAKMARTRALSPPYWAALGFALGPLVFPFLVLATGRSRHEH